MWVHRIYTERQMVTSYLSCLLIHRVSDVWYCNKRDAEAEILLIPTIANHSSALYYRCNINRDIERTSFRQASVVLRGLQSEGVQACKSLENTDLEGTVSQVTTAGFKWGQRLKLQNSPYLLLMFLIRQSCILPVDKSKCTQNTFL